MPQPSELRVPAIEVVQGRDRKLYSFAVDGKRLHDFATVSRVSRDKANHMSGYQRPEVQSHIREIQSYIESDNPMIPNSLVLAFDERVRFEPLPTQPRRNSTPFSRLGELVIPLGKFSETDKPGWIVDGQQRAAAMREARVGGFPICVSAFITGDEREQREQFILVNSTKPLSRSLIYELLPSTDAQLASHLQKRRFPAQLLERLNYDKDSPFQRLIQTPTTPLEKVDKKLLGIIKDNSILKMVENSLTEGLLYRFRDASTGRGDEEEMLVALKAYWNAVKTTFPQAWGLQPRKSRLMHGAGIVSMGFIMDAIADRHKKTPSEAVFARELKKIVSVCRWTSGFWDFGRGLERKWSDIQNTGKDIQLLTGYLLHAYRRAADA